MFEIKAPNTNTSTTLNMEFLNYRNLKQRQNKRGLLYKRPNPRDLSTQYYTLSRELDEHKLHAGLCHLAINTCYDKDIQIEALLNAARAFSKGANSVISLDDHVQTVKWIYKEALQLCDPSFIIPIYSELGRYYESQNKHMLAADCFKQSMSISRCVHNLLLSKSYKRALEELRSSPSHLLSKTDHTTLFLLVLLLQEDFNELNHVENRVLCEINDQNNLDHLPLDDQTFNLNGLLESLLAYHKDKKCNKKIQESIAQKLSAFLDQAQIQLLYLVLAKAN